MDGIGILLQLQHYGWVNEPSLVSREARWMCISVSRVYASECSLLLKVCRLACGSVVAPLCGSPGFVQWNPNFVPALLQARLLLRWFWDILMDVVYWRTMSADVCARPLHALSTLNSNLCCFVPCRCQYSGPWTSWLKLVHEEYLPMLTRITSIPSPLIVTMKRTYLQMTCVLICGT